MKQLVVLSGKGGTGKTTVAAALAHLAAKEIKLVLADADVDAANLELVLEPGLQETHEFLGGSIAIIDPNACHLCGTCAEVCRFDAVFPGDETYHIDPLACEGCASCFYQCPEDAIRMDQQHAGRWFRSETRWGHLFHAHLFAGQENSGKLVALVKQQARSFGANSGADLLLVDGPPGIGCPVIAAVAGADMALLVVEPTVSGIHDLGRILSTVDHFSVSALVAVNKADLNPDRAEQIAAYCAEQHVKLVGLIPYDTVVTEAMVQGQPVTAYTSGHVAVALQEVWAQVKAHLLTEQEPASKCE